jgi:thioredoxin-like negative regulator of GroEL
MTIERRQRIREITDAASLGEVIDQPSCPALVLFDAAWCSPARRIEDRLLRLSREVLRGGSLNLVRVDVDRLPELARRFAVHAVPALVLFRFGQVAAMRLGEVDDRDLRRWLDNAGLDNAGVDGPAVGSSSPPCVPSSGQSTIHSRT